METNAISSQRDDPGVKNQQGYQFCYIIDMTFGVNETVILYLSGAWSCGTRPKVKSGEQVNTKKQTRRQDQKARQTFGLRMK